jgi:hypothetical protein
MKSLREHRPPGLIPSPEGSSSSPGFKEPDRIGFDPVAIVVEHNQLHAKDSMAARTARSFFLGTQQPRAGEAAGQGDPGGRASESAAPMLP